MPSVPLFIVLSLLRTHKRTPIHKLGVPRPDTTTPMCNANHDRRCDGSYALSGEEKRTGRRTRGVEICLQTLYCTPRVYRYINMAYCNSVHLIIDINNYDCKIANLHRQRKTNIRFSYISTTTRKYSCETHQFFITILL
jgi:hypothetical protein